MNNLSRKDIKQISNFFGNKLTKRFLGSKHVVMVSEGDYVLRLKIIIKAVSLLIFYTLFFCVFMYYFTKTNIVWKQTTDATLGILLEQQKFVLISMISILLINGIMAACSVIVMLNMTMGKGCSIFAGFFNIIYIAEALFFSSIIYIMDFAGVIRKFSNMNTFLNVLQTQWIWIAVYILGFIVFIISKSLFTNINQWYREWVKVDNYRKTQNKENGFIFKTWITKNEIKARKLLIAASWLLIICANGMDLSDLRKVTTYDSFKYVVLLSGYAFFIGSFIVRYSKISLIYFWGSALTMIILFSFGLYHIQNTAWKSKFYFEYSYITLFIPLILTLVSCSKYTWSIINQEQVQAIVVTGFETPEEFEIYVEENNKLQNKDDENNINENILNI